MIYNNSVNAQQAYSDLLTQLAVGRDKMKAISKALYSDMMRGLHQHDQTLKMIPSHVNALPTGKERGTFMSLDLGGTNFRVCLVTLMGDGRFKVVSEKYIIPQAHKEGGGSSLFKFVAECVSDFVKTQKQERKESEPLLMGFTFSFAVHQTDIAKGTIMALSKGFHCQEIIGKDVVELLQSALSQLNVHVKVVALVNDTVGTLAAHAYVKPNTTMGVIFGTGTNAAYLEQTKEITKLYRDDTVKCDGPDMIINTEWGGFKDVLPTTQMDTDLDLESSNPGKQQLEKIISGMYLGEVTRRCLIHLASSGSLFRGKVPELLANSPYKFPTASLSAIEADTTPELAEVARQLKEFAGLAEISLNDRQLVKALVQQIGTRAARVSAVAVFTLLERMNLPKDREQVVVAVDGSVWTLYPGFADRLRAGLCEMLGPEKADFVTLESAQDASGVGAAIIAAIVSNAT